MTDGPIMETGIVRGAGLDRHPANSTIHERYTLDSHRLLAGVYLMSHPANRRRFLQTTAGSSIGAWIAAGVSGAS